MKCFRIIRQALFLCLLSPLTFAQGVDNYSFEIDTTEIARTYSIKLIGENRQKEDIDKREEAFKYATANFNRTKTFDILLHTLESYDINNLRGAIISFIWTKNCKIIDLELFIVYHEGYGETLSKEDCVKMLHSFEKAELIRPWQNGIETIYFRVSLRPDESKDAIAAYMASKQNE